MSGASPVVQAPIIIFAFARPEYLRRLCRSLKAQQGVTLDEASIHLMQDGAKSRRSAISYAEPAMIEASIAAFREVFPRGQVHAAPENLGVAMNILRGERHAFQALRADFAYFFEEDLELGPAYLAMMEVLAARFGRHPNLGYFAAYGDHRRQGNPAAPQIVPLEHHWGFGLTRRCWQAMQPWLKPFHQVYQQVDYQARPHLRIVELFAQCRVSSMASSQDVAKTMACADLGFARINTDVGFARYIGAVGESFREDRFVSHGFAEAPVVEALPEQLPEGSAEVLDRIAAEKFEACSAHRRDAYERELAVMRRTFFNPDRPVTREELEALWRLLMDRLPTDDEYYAKNVGVRTLRQVRRSLLRSREAQGKGFYLG
ncbi:glycosyltransferase family protein [Falsiroseomonas ponticola]|uniref:glycosyltransferase n=1 Tax=Falsiroseomonas ponticola TaxID=2786951 RepID=UPI001933A972|nr:glycosyltransferase [Roseomonas ponticola]